MSYKKSYYIAAKPKRKDKKAAVNARQILTTTNPEILISNPRPGGFLPIHPEAQPISPKKTPSKLQSSIDFADSDSSLYTQRNQECYKETQKCSVSHLNADSYYAYSREHTINFAMKDPLWNSILLESDVDYDTTSSLVDNMLGVTISCVMLMASKASKIPEKYFMWTERYLSCIKDELGNHPPNIQGILNYIRYLRTKKPSKDISRTSLHKSSKRKSSKSSVKQVNSSTSQVKSRSHLRSNIPISTRNSLRSAKVKCYCDP